MWIDTEEKLSVAIADLLETEVVAVDTEYDSFHYFYENSVSCKWGRMLAVTSLIPWRRLM